MNTQVVIRNAENGNGLRAFAEEKLAETLARFERAVMSAIVRLEDVTGSEKETADDKLCNVHIKLRTGEIVIKEQASDFHAAINTAMDRLKAKLSREIGRGKHGIAG